MKKIVTPFLCGLLAFCSLFSACDSSNTPPTPPADTEITLVEDGETVYEIVLPVGPSDYERRAATEINTFMKKASGAQFEVIYEDDVEEFNSDYEYIYIGSTVFTTEERVGDISVEKLTTQGYVLKNIDNAIFIVGGDEFGTLFGAYEFLSRTIGWDCIAVDEIIYEESDDVTFPETDLTDVPDIEYRVVGNIAAYNDNTFANRFRFIRAHTHGFMYVNNTMYHNCFAYLPPARYNDANNKREYHPDWYSKAGVTEYATNSDPIQLCYTAHGNKDEYDLMQSVSLEVLKETVLKNPENNNVQFTMWDNEAFCECATCQAEKQKYGTNSAVIVKFLNDLKGKLDAWLEEEEIDREIGLCFFAYQAAIDAPVKENADGTYSLIDGLKCADGVFVFYAPLYANWYCTLDDETPENSSYAGHEKYTNAKYDKDIEKWSLVSDQMYLWYYSTNFAEYLMPYCNFGSIKGNIEYAVEKNTRYLFHEGKHYDPTPNPTGFTYLKDYLEAKLMWDCTLDQEELTDTFFDAYFGDASRVMREYYNSLNQHSDANLKYRQRNNRYDLSCYERSLDKSLWPLAKVKEWQSCIDEAYEAIEYLKEVDEDRYEVLSKRILIESMAVRYIYLDLYVTTDNPTQATALRQQYKKDAVSLRYREWGQGNNINNLWNKWGV